MSDPAGVLKELLKPKNVDKLKTILTYHVVSGSVHARDLRDGESVTTLEGQKLRVTVNGDHQADEDPESDDDELTSDESELEEDEETDDSSSDDEGGAGGEAYTDGGEANGGRAPPRRRRHHVIH